MPRQGGRLMGSPLDRLSRASAAVAVLVDRVEPDQMSWPTPCTDWDVRGLLNHMIGEHRSLAIGAAGSRPDIAVVFGTDYCAAGDPAQQYRQAAEEATAAASGDGVLAATLDMPYGAVTGVLAVAVAVHEQLVHAWDLARAIDQEPRLPEDDCVFAIQVGQAFPSDLREGDSPAFGQAVPADDDLPAPDRLAAFMGRDLGFRAVTAGG